ncbi:hypothetical protein TNCV_2135631 [Trichonephila clavipes]|nr:hypothetical protein TNCV_2135631 [Trichonephila clavipes]
MKEIRIETENETRIREARHKEKEQARLKAEEETKAVEERRRMEEERRMNDKEMRPKKEIRLVEEQIRHVVASDAVEQPVAVEEEKGLSRDSSNVPLISAKDEMYEIKEKPKLPKRKLKELSRITGVSSVDIHRIKKGNRKTCLETARFYQTNWYWEGVAIITRERRSRDNESQDEEKSST